MSGGYPASIFIIVPVDDVMAAVFDAPMAAVGFKDAFGVGLVRGSAGDAVDNITGVFTGFFVCGFALNHKSLSGIGKGKIAVERGRRPNFALFDTSVVGRITKDKIRLPGIFKEQCDVFKKTRLVFFDGKVVMSLTILDQVDGKLALGQEGIGGNVLALNIDV